MFRPTQNITGVDTSEMYYETPNINQLLKEGTAFSQAYANTLCSPIRACLLMGKIAASLGFTTSMPLLPTYITKIFRFLKITMRMMYKLVLWLERNVDKQYWPKLNPDYNAKKEVGKKNFRNLSELYEESGTVVHTSPTP